jgi:PKHD-type hydroxylase
MRTFDLLQGDELMNVIGALGSIKYQDGRDTAFGQAKAVKDNLEIDNSDPAMQELTDFMASKILTNPNTYWLLFPRTISRPIVSKTANGGRYGTHVDASQMTDIYGLQMRTDISFTIFLSDPDSYDGGELSIQNETGTADIKLPPGHVVFYNSGLLHEVKPVTRGERIACIGWVESMIYDEVARNALYSLREMQEVLGEHVDKGDPVYQDYQAAVNAMRRCLIGRL